MANVTKVSCLNVGGVRPLAQSIMAKCQRMAIFVKWRGIRVAYVLMISISKSMSDRIGGAVFRVFRVLARGVLPVGEIGEAWRSFLHAFGDESHFIVTGIELIFHF
jgi:hypothetical protein